MSDGNVFLDGWCSWSEEAPVLVASLGKRWHGLAGWNCFPALYVISTSPLCPPPLHPLPCSAPLLCVHAPNCTCARAYFYMCTRILVHIVPPRTHTRAMHPPPVVTVIAHLLHSVRIKTTKPLFRCSSDIRANLGKWTATWKSRFWGWSLIVFK